MSEALTEQDIVAIKDRLNRASKTPWKQHYNGLYIANSSGMYHVVCTCAENMFGRQRGLNYEAAKNNMDLIANAPSDISKLLQHAEAIESENKWLREQIEKILHCDHRFDDDDDVEPPEDYQDYPCHCGHGWCVKHQRFTTEADALREGAGDEK